MSDRQQQRFHGRRTSAMRMGLRGLLFTANPKQEPKALREISQIVEKALNEFPEEVFNLPQQQQQQQQQRREEERGTEHKSDVDDEDNEDGNDSESDCGSDDDSEHKQKPQSKAAAESLGNSGGGGFSFTDELQQELAQMKQQNQSRGNNAGERGSTRQQRSGAPMKPKRFRIMDTNCKGYVFVAIHFAETAVAGDKSATNLLEEEEEELQKSGDAGAAVVADDDGTDDGKEKRPPPRIVSILTSSTSQLVLDAAGKIVKLVSTSDVPLLRFTFYMWPVLLTAAPTLNSACFFADAIAASLVPVPKGKSAARVETHFLVRNNSGVNSAVIDAMRESMRAKLPMRRFLVMNAGASAGARRQRQKDGAADGPGNNNNKPEFPVHAAISFIVLHSVAMLALQSEYTEKGEYALHKMGASFADSLSG